MEMFTYPITVDREGRKYWAYSEDFPGVYGLGNSIEEAKASILESMRLYIEECRARQK
jgi:predicted RNase H-like HicB family nuclease